MQLVLPDIGSSQTMTDTEEISRRVAEAVSTSNENSREEIEQEEIELNLPIQKRTTTSPINVLEYSTITRD